MTKKDASKFFKTIKKYNPVHIFGDYDADGILASLCLFKAINYLYPKLTVDVHIPDRFSEGYGVNKPWVETITDGIIVTVDNGIAAEEVLKDAAVPFIVTDHHIGPDNVENSLMTYSALHAYPDSGLSGCALIYQLCEDSGLFPPEFLDSIRPYAAITIISDVCPVGNKNKSWQLAHNEILRMRKTGVPERLKPFTPPDVFFTQNTIGFSIAPVINAAGRMLNNGGQQMFDYLAGKPGSKDAQFFLDTNELRKAEVKKYADIEIPELTNPIVLQADCVSGIPGLIAAKLCEKYHVPAIVVTTPNENGVCHGSMRAPDGYHCVDYLTEQKDKLLSFGGHDGAGGLKLLQENLDKLERTRVVKIDKPRKPVTNIADPFKLEEIFLIEDERMPFGPGNPQPRYELTLDTKITHPRYMGPHLKFECSYNTQVVWWNYGTEEFHPVPEYLTVTGEVEKTTYQGITKTTFTVGR